jgi:CRP-like cAMP-binding protein
MNPADLFRQETDTLQLSSGEVLFREGEKADLFYIVLEGSLEILVGENVVEMAERGAIVGEMALIEDAPRSATVIAKTPSRLVGIDQKRFRFLVQQTPNFAIHVMKALADRLRRMDQRLATSQK